MSIDLILFDLDGVITTEHIYWECARLTLWELLHVHMDAGAPYIAAVYDTAERESMLPPALIGTVKARAINSNWDLTYLAACALVGALQPKTESEPADSIPALLARMPSDTRNAAWPRPLFDLLAAADSRTGPDLLDFAGAWAAQSGIGTAALFTPEGPWWQYLFGRFQAWLDGRLLGVWGAPRLRETLTLPPNTIRAVLESLRSAGYTLGIATGRPHDEALPPLRDHFLLSHFASNRICTYDDVQAAQNALGMTKLGKPHPFPLRRAIFPEAAMRDLVSSPDDLAVPNALFIGDAASDAAAARAAGIPCVGVLSGVESPTAKQERRKTLLDKGCVAVLEDITALPDFLRGR